MPRNYLKLDVDVSKASKKIWTLEKKLTTVGHLAVKEVGELGKYYARSIAPYWSGKTFRNITLRKGSGTEAIIFVRNPTASDGHSRNISNFNLVRWMHQSPRAKVHIQSGEPKFMYKTRDYLKGLAPVRVKARYNQLVAEINNK